MRSLLLIIFVVIISSCQQEEKKIEIEDVAIKETINNSSEKLELADFLKQLSVQSGRDTLDFSTILDSLPKEFYNEVQVRVISIDGFISNSVTYLAPQIENLEKLERFSLVKTGIKTLPPEIGNLKSLHSLYVNWGGQLETLPESIGNLENLIVLDLWRNNLTTLPASIENLKKLKLLNLGENNFDEKERLRIRKLLPNCEVVFDY